MEALKADELKKSDSKAAELLLQERKKLEMEQTKLNAKINPRLKEISAEVSTIDKQLLELAEDNYEDWWPGDGKTKEFESGKLMWRATSSLVNGDGEPVSEENTDLLGLAKKAGFRDLVKISPVMNKIKSVIEIGKMPKGFEDLEVKVTDGFSVSTK